MTIYIYIYIYRAYMDPMGYDHTGGIKHFFMDDML